MECLKLSDIRPFVRKVGIAFGLKHSRSMKAYDYRLIFFSEGGNVWLGGVPYALKAWDVAFISPGTTYRIVTDKKQKITVINFDLTCANRAFSDKVLFAGADVFDAQMITEPHIVADFVPDCGYFIKRADESVFKLCAKMSRVYFDTRETPEVKALLLSATLMQILAELMRTEPTRNEKAEKIYQFICRNFQRDLSLEDLSAQFNYHKTYINRLLKKDYGVCFKQLVIELRLNHSLVLLEESDMSLSEIADCLGFYDCKHFGHAFKNRYGITPSAYRK